MVAGSALFARPQIEPTMAKASGSALFSLARGSALFSWTKIKRTSRVSFIFMDQNTVDHQGQLYFQKMSLVKIKLTLRVRVSLAHENKADLDGPLIFMGQNKADQQGQLYFHGRQ